MSCDAFAHLMKTYHFLCWPSFTLSQKWPPKDAVKLMRNLDRWIKSEFFSLMYFNKRPFPYIYAVHNSEYCSDFFCHTNLRGLALTYTHLFLTAQYGFINKAVPLYTQALGKFKTGWKAQTTTILSPIMFNFFVIVFWESIIK